MSEPHENTYHHRARRFDMKRKLPIFGEVTVKLHRDHDGKVGITDENNVPLRYEELQFIADRVAAAHSQRSLGDMGLREIQCLRVDAPELAHSAGLRQRLSRSLGAPHGCQWNDDVLSAVLSEAGVSRHGADDVLRWLLENSIAGDPIGITAAELREMADGVPGQGNEIRRRGLVVKLVEAGFVHQRGSGDNAAFVVDPERVDAACQAALERRPGLNL